MTISVICRGADLSHVGLQLLSDDFSKAAFLCCDRSVHFHARYGAHYTTRIPRFGRALAYDPVSTDLLLVGSAPEIYRLNLAEGRFLAPIPARAPASNAVDVSSVHGLVACAGEEGFLECFDMRQRASAGHMDAAAALGTVSYSC